jgi:integrase
MATLRKLPSGCWQAIVRRKGVPAVSKTFRTKLNAERWARSVELQIDQGSFIDRSEAENTSISDLIDRYLAEVTIHKKGRLQEERRLKYLKFQFGTFSAAGLQSKQVAAHRDRRLKEGRAGQTVIHELNLLSSIFETAVREWGLALANNPVKLIKRPAKAKGRDRRITPAELDGLLQALKATKEMPWIVQLAVETGMRRSELLALEWRNVDVVNRVALLLDTKNGERRFVPLSNKAVDVLSQVSRNSNTVFSTSASAVSHSFARACERVGLGDFRFHDLRHEAVSRLFEKGLNPVEAAAVSGHKSLAMLKRYTHLKAADLALKLD